MTFTPSFRIRRRAVNAFEPAATRKGEVKEQSFFGPTKAAPFFPPAVQRAPESDGERAHAKSEMDSQEEEKKKKEDKVQAKSEGSPQEEDEKKKKQQHKDKDKDREKEEEKKLHAKAEAGPAKTEAMPRSRTAGRETADYVRNIDGRGQPLSEQARAWFGQQMGYDFSEVRIHTGSDAEASAKASQAKAYTYGKHVVFGRGQYDLGSQTGRHLLAHELAHVVQRSSASGVGAIKGVARALWRTLRGGTTWAYRLVNGQGRF